MNNVDIVSLAQELERQRSGKLDVVVSTRALKATSDGGVVKVEVPEHGSYPLTEWGHLQLAEKTNIPKRYYDAMRGAGLADLVAQNVNAWIARQADKRLVRISDGKVRALLSDRYRVLDNFDLAMMTMERAKEHGAQVLKADLSETRMYVKVVVPEYRQKLEFTPQEHAAHTIRRAGDDEVIPGLLVSNSEVGSGAFRVEPFLWRTSCSNGLIGEDSLYKVHLGQRMELGELIYSDETRKLEDAALWSKVRDIIDATFDIKMLKVLIERMAASKAITIEKPIEVADVVARNLQLSEDKRNALLAYFVNEGSTLFGLVNGITRLAQDFEDPDEQVRLERTAGEILRTPAPVLQVA